MTAGSRVAEWRSALAWIPRGIGLGVLAFVIFGPIANLVLWAFAERWYFPYKLPVSFGLRFWYQVFRPSSDALATLGTSISIALFCVIVCLALAIPAGFALARGRLPWRGLILLAFLLPQAFPSITVYFNVARIFYTFGLNGTIPGVVLVHAVHGLVFAVWIAAASFAALDPDLELAARNIGASRLRSFLTVTLPLAAPGIM
ncbi:MAG: ABC transporter permease subunit, partial [Alphaproteobacteria bacterium]|nr:ABC transporter permease subunit [Alphaproteobacteria bacterium]